MKPDTLTPEEEQRALQAVAHYGYSDEEAAALAVPWRTPDVHDALAAEVAASGVPITYVLPGVSGEPTARDQVRWANYEQ